MLFLLRIANLARCELASLRPRSDFPTLIPRANSISPAFEWAQSGDWVYINAKMSHKLDAPATLNVVSEGVQMGERSLKFAASKDHKRFALELALHADIDPDVSEEEETRREGAGGGGGEQEPASQVFLASFELSCDCGVRSLGFHRWV